jgi:hypothetical protein
MIAPALALALALAALAQGEPDEIRWFDASALTIEGRGWDTLETPWSRLPLRARELVREQVWLLSQASAGVAVRFVSDARELHARWTLASPVLSLPHMPATGASGLDLYVRDDEGRWRWLANGMPRSVVNEQQLVADLPPGGREFLLFLPLYNGVLSLELGSNAGATIAPAPAQALAPIVFYGTSITQGAAASRPGTCHVALLRRWLDRPVVNLGFSGQGRMELELAGLLGEIDAAAYVIDCLPNMSAELVVERTSPFVRALRETRPTAPILLVEDRTYQDSWLRQDRLEENLSRRAALRREFEALVADGVTGLHLVSGEELLGVDGEASVDGSHPTDLGFQRQAEVLRAALRPLLPR